MYVYLTVNQAADYLDIQELMDTGCLAAAIRLVRTDKVSDAIRLETLHAFSAQPEQIQLAVFQYFNPIESLRILRSDGYAGLNLIDIPSYWHRYSFSDGSEYLHMWNDDFENLLRHLRDNGGPAINVLRMKDVLHLAKRRDPYKILSILDDDDEFPDMDSLLRDRIYVHLENRAIEYLPSAINNRFHSAVPWSKVLANISKRMNKRFPLDYPKLESQVVKNFGWSLFRREEVSCDGWIDVLEFLRNHCESRPPPFDYTRWNRHLVHKISRGVAWKQGSDVDEALRLIERLEQKCPIRIDYGRWTDAIVELITSEVTSGHPGVAWDWVLHLAELADRAGQTDSIDFLKWNDIVSANVSKCIEDGCFVNVVAWIRYLHDQNIRFRQGVQLNTLQWDQNIMENVSKEVLDNPEFSVKSWINALQTDLAVCAPQAIPYCEASPRLEEAYTNRGRLINQLLFAELSRAVCDSPRTDYPFSDFTAHCMGLLHDLSEVSGRAFRLDPTLPWGQHIGNNLANALVGKNPTGVFEALDFAKEVSQSTGLDISFDFASWTGILLENLAGAVVSGSPLDHVEAWIQLIELIQANFSEISIHDFPWNEYVTPRFRRAMARPGYSGGDPLHWIDHLDLISKRVGSGSPIPINFADWVSSVARLFTKALRMLYFTRAEEVLVYLLRLWPECGYPSRDEVKQWLQTVNISMEWSERFNSPSSESSEKNALEAVYHRLVGIAELMGLDVDEDVGVAAESDTADSADGDVASQDIDGPSVDD